ncbi:uncharacterized protein LOC141672047 isoform X2 [Apium graveolens]|uniref:uncharacterized protein LOC141672047 isoform X2 n=1 Tax=Apium graveolens TaxID=4045 RepID=UPI003D7BD7EA
MMSSNYTSVGSHNFSGSVPAVSDSPPQVSVKFTDSALQTFPPSGAQGKITKASGPPHDADVSFSKPVSGSSGESQSSDWFRVFTVGAYKPYFDVDTSDVLDRIKDSLLPFDGSFYEKTSDRPDLYGPFWICTTLIFVAAAISTLVTYLAQELKNEKWEYDINLVTWSAGLFYGYVLVVPLCLYVILKYFSVPSGLAQLLCLYGYSLFVFIPALCLSVIPLDLFRWVIAGVAGVMSATFVSLNLRNHIKSASDKWLLIVTGIFLLQLALSMVLKLYLFTVTV